MSKFKPQERRQSGPVAQHHDPPIRIQEAPIQERLRAWPHGEPMPSHYRHAKRLMPCPACRSVTLADGGQAVVVRSTSGGLAYLRCKICQNHWKMPITE